MAQYRVLVSTQITSDPTAENSIVNTFYLDTDALGGADDPQALADDAAALWATSAPRVSPFDNINVRLYSMSDPVPREPVAEANSPVSSATPGGPREVAVCLSYFAGRNIPRRRGRLFMGPWAASSMGERPSNTIRDQLATLAEGISGLGGINVQWVHYSPTDATFTNVSDYWIDDEWDTMRSRGLDPTTRTTGTVEG